MKINRLKKYSASALIVALIGAQTTTLPLVFAEPTAAPAAPLAAQPAPLFTDVQSTHPHYTALKSLKDAGFINGYPDGSFKPEASITRAESLAILLKVAGITAEKSSVTLPFSDVKSDSWFYAMVQKAVALKKVKGFEDGTFKPLANITLPEAFALTFSFLNINTQQTQVEGTIYAGIDSKGWYAPLLQYAKNMFILTPTLVATTPTARYDLTKPLTRAEFAEIVYRSRKVKQDGKALDITAGWITTTHQDNYWQLTYPADWAFFKGSANSVLWNKKSYSPFYTRVWPTGVRLSISLDDNSAGLSPAAYFDIVKRAYADEYGAASLVSSNQTLGGRSALKLVVPEHHVLDTYIQLAGNKFLVLYGEYGSAPISEFYKKQLELVVASYTYVEPPPVQPKVVIPLEKRLETLRTNILIEKGWNTVKDLFDDKKLIETDAIGVGTGPVDYYFSAEANYTIKLERNSATILNIKSGNTSAF